MDIRTQTTSPVLGDGSDPAIAALQALVDQSAIRDLAALYAIAVDDHDIETVLDMFAEDGSFARAGSVVTGRDELRVFYQSMMKRYVTTLHVPHSHVVAPRGDRATGLLTGHAELSLDGTLMMAAYRYDDTYVRAQSRWLFQSRVLRFMYVVPFEQMPTAFRDSRRIRWPESPYAAADLPETLATWHTYAD